MAVIKHLGWATTVLIAQLLAGCDHLRNWHGDETANPEYVLKIEIPSGATDVAKRSDPDVGYDITFLMPDDQWHTYATRYYPTDKLTAKAITGDAGAQPPSVCSVRDGAELTEWSASDRIPFLKSAQITAPRHLWVVPDCKPGQAYVHWLLIPPSAAPASPTT